MLEVLRELDLVAASRRGRKGEDEMEIGVFFTLRPRVTPINVLSTALNCNCNSSEICFGGQKRRYKYRNLLR